MKHCKTNLGDFVEGDEVNLERGMLLNTRFRWAYCSEGHIDGTAVSLQLMKTAVGICFENDGSARNLLVEKALLLSMV